MTRRLYTVAEVAAAYRPRFANELRTEWAVALIYRPVSLVVTPLFALLGATPTAVTLLGLILVLALPYAAFAGGAGAWVTVGLLAIAFNVLDCVDGNLARVTGRTSERGAYLDFAVDMVYRACFYAAIGLAADHARAAGASDLFGDHGGIVAALAAALLALHAKACRLYVEAARGPETRHPTPGAGPGDVGFAFVSGLDHLQPVAVLILGALGGLDWLLAWMLAYSFADFAHTQSSLWKRLR